MRVRLRVFLLMSLPVILFLGLFYWPAVAGVTDGALARSVTRNAQSPNGVAAISCGSENGRKSCHFLAGSIPVEYDITMRGRRCWTGHLASTLPEGFAKAIRGCVTFGDVIAFWRVT